MTIKLICSECGSRMSAPDALLGKKGKCPKCGRILIIRPTDESRSPADFLDSDERGTAGRTAGGAGGAEGVGRTGGTGAAAMDHGSDSVSAESQIIVDDLPTLIKTEGVPRRISFDNIYAVLNNERILAFWKRGEGWQFNTSHGYVLARGADSLIPEQGDFILIEGNVRQTEEGHRLAGVQFFKISGIGALKSITRSDGEIFEKIVGRVPLGMTQKRQFLLFLRDRYFSSFTENAGDVIDYLTNEDFHSDQIGDIQNEESEGLPTE